MKSHKGRFDPTRFEDLAVTIDFHCHSACRFCIVQEGMNYFRGVPFDAYRKAIDDNARSPRYRRLVFTGGEVTLEPKLFDYLAYAREATGFEHIRIQTNGRRLADMAFAKRLVDAGIDEFFVSLHGPDAECQDYISQRPGSFDEAVHGLRNLQELGVCIMTNTVLTTLNVDRLVDIVDLVATFEPARMEFWNYLPMEDYADTRDLLVPMARLGPAMTRALAHAEKLGVHALAKYVPQCILGDQAHKIDNSQPDVVIVEKFYDVYPEFNCIYEAKCEHSEECLGLHHPYISKFGWEEQLLSPTPRSTPWKEPDYGLALKADAPGQGPEEAPSHVGPPEWEALVDGVAERFEAVLDRVHVERRRCIFRFSLSEGGSVDVVMTALAEDQPALLRSRSFNIHYRNVVGDDKHKLGAIVKAVALSIVERDRGHLSLDTRKGLVGAGAFRKRRSS